MKNDDNTPEGPLAGPRDVMIAALIVGLGVAIFATAYAGGRDIGSVLF
ncbi:hypothetical protein [Erythrobacter sp. R86502]